MPAPPGGKPGRVGPPPGTMGPPWLGGAIFCFALSRRDKSTVMRTYSAATVVANKDSTTAPRIQRFMPQALHEGEMLETCRKILPCLVFSCAPQMKATGFLLFLGVNHALPALPAQIGR